MSGLEEPQHPPCEIDYHQPNGGCGFMRCYYCGIIYPLGQKIQRPAGWHYFPDAERSLWEHWRTEEHQRITKALGLSMYQALEAIPDLLKKSKAYQKQAEDPNFIQLKSLLR